MTDSDQSSDDGLDVSDLARHMGVPIMPGELKDPIALNDVRRWVQAMHYPNPLHYDELLSLQPTMLFVLTVRNLLLLVLFAWAIGMLVRMVRRPLPDEDGRWLPRVLGGRTED